MNVSYDIFAEVNPAFCTFCLVGFCGKYEIARRKAPTLALMYIALPLALSNDLELSFDKTNSATGLLSWLSRYPDVLTDLGDRLDAGKENVSDAIRFALAVQALSLDEEGALRLGTRKPPMSTVADWPANPKRAVKRAERLGTWMGKAGSTGAIFSVFGVEP